MADLETFPEDWDRALGRSLLDAVRDAANPWVFTDRGDAWDGVRFTAFSASPQPTHGVDTTATFEIIG